MRGEVGGNRADVAPVAVEPVLLSLATIHQPRQQLVAQVVERVAARIVGEILEDVEDGCRVKDEDFGCHEIAGRLVRLVRVPGDGPGVVDLHDAIPIRIVECHSRCHHGHARPELLMSSDHVPIVEAIGGIGAHDDESIRGVVTDERGMPPQRIGGAVVPAGTVGPQVRGQHQQAPDRAVEVPRATVRQVIGDRRRMELLNDPEARVVCIG